MSDTGVLSGIFGQLSEYSLALNRLLVELKAGTPDAQFNPPAPVRELITRLSEQWHSELAIQALANALNSSAIEFDGAAAGRLHQALKTSRSYPQIVTDLEGLAKLVRSQQTGAYFRLRHPV